MPHSALRLIGCVLKVYEMKLLNFEFDGKKAAVFGVFTIIGLLLYQVQFSKILGASSQSFSLFQLAGPSAAAVLGPVFGVLSVVCVEALNFILSGKAFEPINVARMLPMAFAALYFGSKKKATGLVAAACMLLFWMHPIGAQAWFYPLYWIIPIAASFFKENILARSLGATFTAHAVGSVAFLYAYSLPVEVWASLMPIVAMERLAFAAGIALSYYAINTGLAFASSKVKIPELIVEKKYALFQAKEE